MSFRKLLVISSMVLVLMIGLASGNYNLLGVQARPVTISVIDTGYSPMQFSGIVKVGCHRDFCLNQCPQGQVRDCDHCMYAQYIFGFVVDTWWKYENCSSCRNYC